MKILKDVCMLLLASWLLLLNLDNTYAKVIESDTIAKRHPEDKCGGEKMFYTPLVRTSDEEELGVCDSSCSAIVDALSTSSNTTNNNKRMMHKMRRHSQQEQQKRSSTLYTCDDTRTFPEEEIPENIKDNFPFNMRTCFFRNTSGKKGSTQQEVEAQNTFEQACNQAKGTFVRPLHKTW